MTELFIVNKNINSTVVQDKVYCKIANVEIKSIAYQTGKQLIKYQIYYWLNVPTENEEPVGLLQTYLDNVLTNTFTTTATTEALTIEQLQSHCVYDFNNVQNVNTDSHLRKALINNIWDKQYYNAYVNNKVYCLQYLDRDNIYIGRIEHTAVYNTVDYKDLKLDSSTVSYTITDPTWNILEEKILLDVPYKNNDSYFTDILINISPANTLNTFQLVHY